MTNCLKFVEMQKMVHGKFVTIYRFNMLLKHKQSLQM
jgi:hypothetical protein